MSNSCDLEMDADEYVESFKPQMIGLVDLWCQGSSFSHIIEMTDIFEGFRFSNLIFVNLIQLLLMFYTFQKSCIK